MIFNSSLTSAISNAVYNRIQKNLAISLGQDGSRNKDRKLENIWLILKPISSCFTSMIKRLSSIVIQNKILNREHNVYLKPSGKDDGFRELESINKVEKRKKILTRDYLRQNIFIKQNEFAYSIYLHGEFLGELEFLGVFGYAFNEGVIQCIAEEMTELSRKNHYDSYCSRGWTDERIEKHFYKTYGVVGHSQPYKFETRMVKELMKRVGGGLIAKSSKSEENLLSLVKAIDDLYGDNTYVQLLDLSDEGDWRQVFKIISSVPACYDVVGLFSTYITMMD